MSSDVRTHHVMSQDPGLALTTALHLEPLALDLHMVRRI